MHLPPHPFWFWLIALVPALMMCLAWVAVNTLAVSIRPLVPWLWCGFVLFQIPYLALAANFVPRPTFILDPGARALRLALGMFSWGCYLTAFFLQRHYMFERLPRSGKKWFFPWTNVRFSIPNQTRVLVANIDTVAPWYADKLGLRKLAKEKPSESGTATFKVKPGGHSVVLTTRHDARTGKTPILFTRRIDKMKDVLAGRGADPSAILRDRQGIRYFQISDPEGNKIEVVEDR